MTYNPTFTHDRRGKWTTEQNAGLTQVVAGSDAYIMEDEFNLMQWMLNEARADLVRKSVNSGVVDYNGPIFTAGIVENTPQYNRGQIAIPATSQYASYPNDVGLSDTTVYINGYKLEISSSNTPGGISGGNNVNIVSLDAPPTSNVTPSLPGSARDDLVFLEAWFQEVSSAQGTADTNLYNYGGVNSGTITNDILDSRPNAETTRRVQMRWRIRVVDGVDFGTYPEGLGGNGASINYAVTSQGGNTSPTTYVGNNTYVPFYPAAARTTAGHTLAPNDTGLYIAGDGSSTAQAGLGSVDGYSYAIPLFRVRRRNSNAFDPDTNPLGGAQYASFNVTMPAGTYTPGQVVSGVTLTSTTGLAAGQYISSGGGSVYWKVNSVDSATTATLLTVMTYTSSGSQNGPFHNISDRPDGLYSNIIDASDIVDLRHQVSLTGFNYQALLEKNLDLLLRGQLTTNQQVRYARDYIGVNTSSYTDDVNTLLYLNFDGSMAGTANGAVVTNTKVGSGTEAYANGVQGLAGDFTAGNYSESYSISVPSGPLTVEGFISKSDVSDGAGHEVWTHSTNFYLQVNNSNGLRLNYPTSNGASILSIPMGASDLLNKHYFKATVDNNGVYTLQVDEKIVTAQGIVPPATTTFIVGAYTSNVYCYKGVVDLIRVSNIVRTTTPLPTGYSYANGDRILDGPDSDFSYWSDDVGATSGVNGRQNPYGLSKVPNSIAARVSYNGSEIRHYLGYANTLTPGWQTSSAGTVPTGAMTNENSAEYTWVVANETVDGTRTTFTFTKPTNAVGLNNLFANSYADIVQVDGAYETASSVTLNNDGSFTMSFPSAPASGVLVRMIYSTGQRHAHFVPSTKGFIIHDWTDDALTGNGSLTVFQTTKYNVTSINHVRVGGVIQNGGYSTSGLNAATTLTAASASAATTITVASASNFVANQNIRISNGSGGWVTATISSISGSTITLTAGLSAAVSANAIVQGAALVTITTAPGNGVTVDLVYESVLTPTLGDYIRVMYQHTPYQGAIALNMNYTILDEGPALVSSLGTGLNYTGPYSGSAGYLACLANLPTAVPDYTFKDDSFNGVLRTATSKPMLRTTWDETPFGFNYTFKETRIGMNVFMSGGGYGTVRGINSQSAVLLSGNPGSYLYTETLSSAVPVQAIYSAIVADANGELKLLVATSKNATTSPTNRLFASDNTTSALDVFKLQGRPLVKSYGGMTA